MKYKSNLKVTSRKDRGEYILDKYRPLFEDSKTVLDVGCGEYASLGEAIDKNNLNIDYIGLDNNDRVFNDRIVYIDLSEEYDKVGGFYDTIVASHVLEHVDKLHELLDYLITSTNKYLILCLPKCDTSIDGKHYGLPVDPPIDRHRWAFSLDAAEKFYMGIANKYGLNVLQIDRNEELKEIWCAYSKV